VLVEGDVWFCRAIQPHFLEVLRYRRIHKTAQGLADRGSLTDGCGRGGLMKISEQMDGRSL
jgi:hypothetical protein